MSRLNLFLKKCFAAAGLEVSRRQARTAAAGRRSLLTDRRIELLLDVGANIGQYATQVREEGYAGRIVSFEPLKDAHAELVLKAQLDPGWTIHERCAIGAAIGEAEINVSRNSVSSSLLPMLAAHTQAAPDSVYVARNLTKVLTLDAVIGQYRRAQERVFLKIDTQGFERHVLEGAQASLEFIAGIQLELSIVPLYASQELYRWFLDYLEQRGFVLWSLVPGYVDPTTGQMVQFDGVFIRREDAAH